MEPIPYTKHTGMQWTLCGNSERVVRWHEAAYPDVYWNTDGRLYYLSPDDYPELYREEIYNAIPVVTWKK